MELVVLLRVQHLQQRRRGVAAHALAEFIHFVEHQDRVGFARLLHRLQDAAGHGAHVGAAVAHDLGVV